MAVSPIMARIPAWRQNSHQADRIANCLQDAVGIEVADGQGNPQDLRLADLKFDVAASIIRLFVRFPV